MNRCTHSFAGRLNKQLKNIYFREFAQTHSLMDCGCTGFKTPLRVARLWPGTSLWQYRMQISEGVRLRESPFHITKSM